MISFTLQCTSRIVWIGEIHRSLRHWNPRHLFFRRELKPAKVTFFSSRVSTHFPMNEDALTRHRKSGSLNVDCDQYNRHCADHTKKKIIVILAGFLKILMKQINHSFSCHLIIKCLTFIKHLY